MKKSSFFSKPKHLRTSDDLSTKSSTNESIQQSEKDFVDFNEMLLSSLPYPSMYIRQKDRIIIAANKIAIDLGAQVGDQCWKSFGKSKYIPHQTPENPSKLTENTDEKHDIKCIFCLAEDCIHNSPTQNCPEVHAFGKIWDAYWIKVSNDVFLHYMVDITERKQIQEDLRESEMFLKQTQQIAMLGTYTLDISSGNWNSSEILNTILGIDTAFEKTFDSWISIVHPEFRKELTDFFMLEIIGIKTKFDKEYKIIRQSDKSVRWVHGIGNIKFNDKNEPIKMIGTIRDITDRKQAEEERKFLIAAVENTDNIVTVKDLDLRVVAANQAFLNICGHTSTNSVIGKTDAEIFGISPDTEPVRTYMEDERKAQTLTQGDYILREEPLILPNGNTITLLTKKYPIFDLDGKLFCTGNVSTDITEIKKAEKDLRLKNISFDTAIAANCIAGLDGLVTEVNEAFLLIFGYESKDKVIGKTLQYFLNNTDDVDAIILDVNHRGHWKGDYTAKREDGSTFDAHGLATLMHDKNGELIGFQTSIIDITDRKKADDSLRKNEQMLLSVLDHFPGVVFWKDLESKYLGCNQAFALAAGFNNSVEIVGKSDFDLPWGDTEAMNYRADDLEVMGNGKIKLHIIETQHQKDDKITWFDTSKIPLNDTENNVMGLIGVSIDITNRKLAEDALKESENKFRTLANYTDDWEYWIDQNGKFLYCSPSCERITGYSASDFEQNPNLLFAIVHHDDLIIYHYHNQMEGVAIEMSQEIQYRILRSDGTIRWIGHVCQPVFDEYGNCIGIRGSNRDITKRKEIEQLLKISEQKYKLLSENITDGIFICKNGYLEYINRSMNHIFGYDEFELDGLKLSQLIAETEHDDLENFLILTPATNQELNIEIKCIKKNSSFVYVEMLLNYVANEKLIYGVVHDITEKKQIQKKNIVKAIIQTEEKERANFSKELHDGLGPLLSTIKLYLQWTKRLKNLKKRDEIILKVEDILEDALTTVKEISNKLSPHLLMNYGLSSAIQSFANKLEETNAINISFHSNAGRRIEMEIEVALYRAIIECINNTIKYANAKNIYIMLNDTGDQIQLHYKDDGNGFNIEKTFAEKRGLGLFNLQSRIQTIGGKIKMFSEVGNGVDYQITVNLQQ